MFVSFEPLERRLISLYLLHVLQFYPARAALHKVLGHENNHIEPTDKEHLFTTIALFVPILACGVFVSDLGLLYQLIGGFCSTSLAYIFPALCYFLIFWKKPTRRNSTIEVDDDDEHGQDCLDDEDSDENEEDGQEDDLVEHAIGDVEGQKKRKGKALLETAEQKRSRRRKERAILSVSEHSQHPLQETTPILISTGNQLRPASYGGTATVHQPSQFSSLSPSSSTTSTESGGFAGGEHGESRPSGRRARRRHGQSKKGETELWLDVGAGVLLVFGVFVMVLSTTITLKKMVGYV